MNVHPSLITNSQPAEAVESGERALHNPPVPSQLLTALYSSPGNPRYDASLAEGFSVSLGVVPFVSVQLDGALAWPTSPLCTSLDGRNGINHLLQHSGVGYVSTCKLQGKGYSSSADHKMALRAWFALIRRVRACALLPFFTSLALTVCESKEALDQPISPASLRVSSSSLCSFSHTPAFSQSRSLRQQVIPEPQPISCGSISHCKPLLSTNAIPVSAARSDMRGLPPLGLGGSGGNSGSITFHNSSDISGLAMPNSTKSSRFC